MNMIDPVIKGADGLCRGRQARSSREGRGRAVAMGALLWALINFRSWGGFQEEMMSTFWR